MIDKKIILTSIFFFLSAFLFSQHSKSIKKYWGYNFNKNNTRKIVFQEVTSWINDFYKERNICIQYVSGFYINDFSMINSGGLRDNNWVGTKLQYLKPYSFVSNKGKDYYEKYLTSKELKKARNINFKDDDELDPNIFKPYFNSSIYPKNISQKCDLINIYFQNLSDFINLETNALKTGLNIKNRIDKEHKIFHSNWLKSILDVDGNFFESMTFNINDNLQGYNPIFKIFMPKRIEDVIQKRFKKLKKLFPKNKSDFEISNIKLSFYSPYNNYENGFYLFGENKNIYFSPRLVSAIVWSKIVEYNLNMYFEERFIPPTVYEIDNDELYELKYLNDNKLVLEVDNNVVYNKFGEDKYSSSIKDYSSNFEQELLYDLIYGFDFALLHELAHFRYNTNQEDICDCVAILILKKNDLLKNDILFNKFLIKSLDRSTNGMWIKLDKQSKIKKLEQRRTKLIKYMEIKTINDCLTKNWN